MGSIIGYIDFYSCMNNYDGGAPESNFKRNIKRPARLSQRRLLASLHVQTGKNFADMVILNRAIKDSGVGGNQDLPEDDNDMEGNHEIVDEEGNHTHRHHCSSTYSFNSSPLTVEYSIKWNPKNVPPTRSFDGGIVEKIANILFDPLQGVDDPSVHCLTCLEH